MRKISLKIVLKNAKKNLKLDSFGKFIVRKIVLNLDYKNIFNAFF